MIAIEAAGSPRGVDREGGRRSRSVKVVEAALVKAGVSPPLWTVSVKGWLASPAPLAAFRVSGYSSKPPGGAAESSGVPAIVAVPSPLSSKLTPSGSAPSRLSAGAGSPPVVTVNEPFSPVAKEAASALVKLGATPGFSTVRVNDWVAWPAPLAGFQGERVAGFARRRSCRFGGRAR